MSATRNAACRAPNEACLPMCLDADTPPGADPDRFGDPALDLLAGFFRAKGLAALKAEDRREEWYQDWIDFQAEHGIYAGLLSPRRWSNRGHRFELRRLTRFLEVFAYFSPSHAYSLHVSFLGIFPILTGTNDALKREAVAALEAGGLFAFAVSEKAHGSDLFSNEFVVRRTSPGRRVADGDKYYIGNANAASIVSVLARDADLTGDAGRRAPFVFFAIRPGESPAFRDVVKIRTLGIRAAFVGSFAVRGHEFAETDVVSEGRDAWDGAFRTIDLGKFLLGFGALGICEHAMTEAVRHMRGRILYDRPVSDLPHIRATTTIAFARLWAMKMYATRALEYLQVACKEDRRYLLFNAVQKARVSTEGVKVLAMLSECIGAKGVESDTYFETALRDAQLVPGLEGSTHINFGLASQFARSYFAGPRAGEPEPVLPGEIGTDAPENAYWMEARNRNAKTVRFADPVRAFESLRAVPNVGVFVRQVEAFRRFAESVAAAEDRVEDGEVLIGIGRCLSCVAYGQLVAEKCTALSAAAVSVVFHGLVEDLAAEALRLSAILGRRGASGHALRRAVRVPRTTDRDLDEVDALIATTYALPRADAPPSPELAPDRE